VADNNVKQPNDSGIPVGVSVRIIIMRQHHDICVGAGVQRVLFSSHVIGCVIDPKDFVSVDAIIDKFQSGMIFIGEWGVIALVVMLKDSA